MALDASSIRICEAKSGRAVEQDASGVFAIHDQRRYVIRSETALVPHEPVLQVQPLSEGRLGTLYFQNYVGLAEMGGLRFRVQHAKLTETAFSRMLDGVVADVADLAFDYGSPTALPFARDDLAASADVRYHALAYLRHIMRRVDRGDGLLGHFLQIARVPHRCMEAEPKWSPVARASSLGPSGLLGVASHPERLVPIPAGSSLSRTGLGRRLPGSTFPAEVLVSARMESFDTHENRLVLHVLQFASELVRAFEGRETMNPDLRTDVRVMREELDWMLSFDFLREVGPLQMVPLQSSVLQRREGYREFLGHFLRLSLSSALAEDRHRWQALLDLKDGALLYELWCFFEVKRVLDVLLGKPGSANLAVTEEERRRVPWSAKLRYQDGQVELVYNPSYRRRSGSYSVTLRPDIVVRVERSSGWEALIFDAKLKFEGDRLDELEDQDPSDWDRTVAREDLYKMHTYRDAIREAVGAFVLYPGSRTVTYAEGKDIPIWGGIGALPLDPSLPTEDLRAFLATFLWPDASPMG
ncbi:DUF2357 domain-containing protein [Polyangium jinanense]|nr:DUF2357 domain-containing protein [Polyangium jinanense]